MRQLVCDDSLNCSLASSGMRDDKISKAIFEWLQWNLTWIKSDRSCQNKFSRSIFWYLCCVPANNLSGTHPSPRLSVGLNCSISHKTSCLNYTTSCPLLENDSVPLDCITCTSLPAPKIHCVTIQCLTHSLLRHLSTLDRVLSILFAPTLYITTLGENILNKSHIFVVDLVAPFSIPNIYFYWRCFWAKKNVGRLFCRFVSAIKLYWSSSYVVVV